ncbi:MAG: YceI family protein [Actinobacteria bacterium]|nr:YceI family protein [Actinomycetota bacterium]
MSTTQDATAIPPGTWSLDPVHSDIGFAVSYSSFGTFRGTFGEFDAKLADGNLEGSAKVASVAIEDPNFAGHLQSPDFFDAERNPELRFTSTSIERAGDAVRITGELTLRGETKEVTISGTATGPGQDLYGNERIAFDVETVVDRRDFGISWNMDLPTGDPALGNDVTITANLALVQA